ncbi:MAG: polyprenol monophosphomannose synthase [Candidatus Hadarchaeales archaeon]
MDQEIDVSVVVPTYNEAGNLPPLIRRLARALRGRRWEVVVVDDGSPDGTGKVAEILARKYPVRLVQRGKRGGLSSAVVEGWRHAGGRVLVVMDADLQHPPELVPELVMKVEEGNDLVLACRTRWVGWRGAASKLMGELVRTLLHLPVRDPHSGFFALRRVVGRIKPRGYKILLECLVRGRYRRVAEVFYSQGKRKWGRSKWGVREGWEYLRQLLDLLGYSKGGR